MNIVDKIKEVVDHPSDPASRAKHIIQELIAPLDKPNQVIVNDLVSLMYALVQNPDNNIEVEQVASTARMLIDELIKPIPAPNKKLADELFEIIVACAKPKKPTAATATSAQAIPQSPSQVQQTTQASQSVQTAAPVTHTTQSRSDEGASQPVLRLLTGEIKELVKKHQLTEQFAHELENKLSNRMVSINDDISTIKTQLQKHGQKIDEMQRSLDKFVGLYEIVINQYNPFIEHTPPAAPETQAKPSIVPATQPAATPAIATNTNATSPLEGITDLSALIDKVKAASDETYEQMVPGIIQWLDTNIKDPVVTDQIKTAPKRVDVLKALIKKSLKMSMQN